MRRGPLFFALVGLGVYNAWMIEVGSVEEFLCRVFCGFGVVGEYDDCALSEQGVFVDVFEVDLPVAGLSSGSGNCAAFLFFGLVIHVVLLSVAVLLPCLYIIKCFRFG